MKGMEIVPSAIEQAMRCAYFEHIFGRILIELRGPNSSHYAYMLIIRFRFECLWASLQRLLWPWKSAVRSEKNTTQRISHALRKWLLPGNDAKFAAQTKEYLFMKHNDIVCYIFWSFAAGRQTSRSLICAKWQSTRWTVNSVVFKPKCFHA